MKTETLLVLFGMAAVTYLTRVGGLWLIGRIQPTPFLERWLRHIPGAVLMAIIAPVILTSGPAELAGAAATVLTAARTKNVLLAMVAGVVVVALVRAFV